MRRQSIRKALILVSFMFLPATLYYFSPDLILEGSAQGILVGSPIFFGLLFVASLFLRRGFCGWLCPGAGLQEACISVKDKQVRGGKYDWIKYGLWVPWISAAVLLGLSAGGFSSIDPFFRTEYGISISRPENYPIYFLVLGLIALPASLIGRRAFCHYLCWMAPFMIIGAKIGDLVKWPVLHLRADKDKCVNCKTCTKACPMSLDVNRMVQQEVLRDSECILCGTCVDGCKQKAIRYSFG